MRQIVVAMVVALTLTGVAVRFGPATGLPEGWVRWLSLLHYWGGVGFLVAFPLYAWDHVKGNRRWLRALRLVTASGVLQLTAAAVLILSGLVLLAYGTAAWELARSIHHWATYPLAVALLLHYLAPKRWRRRA